MSLGMLFCCYRDQYPVIVIRGSEQVIQDRADGLMVTGCLETVSGKQPLHPSHCITI